MEIRQLEMFLAVAEERSFTRAAMRIGVVQSAVSTAVRTLERDLGAPLFERTTQRVGLTDAGAALLIEARRVLAAIGAARDAVDAVRGGLRGTVTLGTMQAQALRPIRLPMLLARFCARYPDVDVRLRHGGGSHDMVRQVRDGKLDLALVAAGGKPPAGVALAPLRSAPMQFAVHRDHPLAGRASVDLSALAKESFVDGPPGWGMRLANDRAFSASGVDRTIAYEINDTAGIIDFVAAGLAVAILPTTIADDVEEIRFVPIRARAPVLEVSIATPTNRPMNAAGVTLARSIVADVPA